MRKRDVSFLQFISEIQAGKNTDSALSIVHSQEYPLSFFSWYISTVKYRLGQTVQLLSVNDHTYEDIVARLHLPFLTGPVVYVLQHIEQLDKKKRIALLKQLVHYNGPNRLVIHGTSTVDFSNLSENTLVLTIPETATRSDCIQLCRIFDIDSLVKDSLIRILFPRKTRITFDSLFFLIQYVPVIPSDQIDLFLCTNIHDGLIATQNLFQLSTVFFKKQPREFYQVWLRMKSHFPEQFWISYFSDQIWRAYHFIAGHNAGTSHKPYIKQITRRLPFSFIETDWHRFNLDDIKRAHHLLYDLDFRIKNGGDPAHLDSFFLFFFS